MYRSKSPPRSKRFHSSERASYRDAPYPRDQRAYRYALCSIFSTSCMQYGSFSMFFLYAHLVQTLSTPCFTLLLHLFHNKLKSFVLFLLAQSVCNIMYLCIQHTHRHIYIFFILKLEGVRVLFQPQYSYCSQKFYKFKCYQKLLWKIII